MQARLVPERRSKPARPADWLVAQLPLGMQDDDFLVRFVRIFQDVADGLLVHADGLPHLADLTVTPTPMVRWLAHWIGVDTIDERMDDVLQRALVDVLGDALQWRGTERGVRALLDLLAGPGVVVEDTGGIRRAAVAGPERPVDVGADTGGHVTVRSPAPSYVGVEDYAALIRAAVPATVTLVVHVDGVIVFSDHPGVPVP